MANGKKKKINTIERNVGYSDTRGNVGKGLAGGVGYGGALGVAAASKGVATVAGAIGAALGSTAGMMGAAAGGRIAANKIQQAVAKRRVRKFGQKGSALVPNKKITGGTGVGDAMREGARAFRGEKIFQGTASTVKGMRKEARYHRQTAKKTKRITARNENIAIKNQAMKERASVVPAKTKKTYKTTGQKIKGKIKNIFGNKFNTPPSPTARVDYGETNRPMKNL